MHIDKSKLGKVLAVYASASFIVLQVVDMFQDRLELPPWMWSGALILLIIGLPIVLATAIVQSNDFKSQLVEKNFTWRRAIGGGVVAFIALIVVATIWARDRFGGNEKLDTNLVAVFPFRVTGADPSLQYLSEGLVDLLGAKLSGEAGVRAADTRTTLAAWKKIGTSDPDTAQLVRAARSIGARRMILGAVVGNSAQLTISASVTDTRTGRTVQHLVSGPADSLPRRVDELAAVLLSLDAGEPRDRLAMLTSTSLPAVRSYLIAEDAYRDANHRKASDNYVAALEADSTFALAALGVLVSAGWGSLPPTGQLSRSRRLAWSHRDRLSEIDRLKLIGYVGSKYPDPESEVAKCKVWPQIIARAPDRAEAWHHKADCIYHYWKNMGLPNRDDARAGFEKSMALDSTFLPNIQHLLPLAVERRDVEEARRLARILVEHDSTSVTAENMRWMVTVAEGKTTAQLLDSANIPKTGNLVTLTEWAIEFHDDALVGDSLLTLSLKRLASESANGRAPSGPLLSVAMLRGRAGDALRHVGIWDSVSTNAAGSTWAVMSALYSDYDTLDVARRIPVLEAAAKPRLDSAGVDRGTGRTPLCVLEQWRLWKGDASNTDAVLARLRKRFGDPTNADQANGHAGLQICAAALQAIRATVQRQPDAREWALRIDSISAEAPSYSAMRFYTPLLASRLLELNGETEKARIAVRRTTSQMGLRSMMEAEWLQDARLSAKLGDRDAAIRAYRRYLGFRRAPDGAGARATEQARRELARLTGET